MAGPLPHLASSIAYTIDEWCRGDFSQGNIRDEPDYTSAFMNGLRWTWQSCGLTTRCLSRVLPQGQERRFGADAMIAVCCGTRAKIALFEAKWPGAEAPLGRIWDTNTHNRPLSHFSDQLDRQRPWAGQIAIWEVFYVRIGAGTPLGHFDLWGSTWVPHDIAYQFDVAQRPDRSVQWTTQDAIQLVSNCRHQYLHLSTWHSMNVRGALLDLEQCYRGAPMTIQDGAVTIEVPHLDPISVPVRFHQNDNGALADDTLGPLGLSHLLVVEMDERRFGHRW